MGNPNHRLRNAQYVLGFEFRLFQTLAAWKEAVARIIPTMREVLATISHITGVFLCTDERKVAAALQSEVIPGGSHEGYPRAKTWDNWTDGFAAFCRGLPEHQDHFERIVRRI